MSWSPISGGGGTTNTMCVVSAGRMALRRSAMGVDFPGKSYVLSRLHLMHLSWATSIGGHGKKEGSRPMRVTLSTHSPHSVRMDPPHWLDKTAEEEACVGPLCSTESIGADSFRLLREDRRPNQACTARRALTRTHPAYSARMDKTRVGPLCSAESISADWLDKTVGYSSPLDKQ